MADSTASTTSGNLVPVPRNEITVLVVDDEPHARAYLRMVLQSLGVTKIWEAVNGSDALVRYSQHRPVVVLLDNNMPVMSGRATIDRLKALDPDVAVVIVTADNDLQTVRFYLEHGAVGYVLKHHAREQVSDMLEEILDAFVVESSDVTSAATG